MLVHEAMERAPRRRRQNALDELEKQNQSLAKKQEELERIIKAHEHELSSRTTELESAKEALRDANARLKLLLTNGKGH
jgi:hypothetical protein